MLGILPNIAYFIYIISYYIYKLDPKDWQIVKKIFCYLYNISNPKLKYNNNI